MVNNKTNKHALKALRDKCLLFNQFMRERKETPPLLAEVFAESDKLIEKAYLEENIKPLLAMNRDIDDQVLRHMPPEMALDAKKMFEEKLNLDIQAINKGRDREIKKIMNKGKISNRGEYELLLNYADEISQSVQRAEELAQINSLLVAYQEKG